MNNNLLNLFPIQPPIDDNNYSEEFFYNNIVKELIPNFVIIMNNGIPVNIQKVMELKENIENNLNDVKEKLKNNKLIKEFLLEKTEYLQKEKINNIIDKYKLIEINFKNQKNKNLFVEYFLKEINLYNEFKKDNYSTKDIRELINILEIKNIDCSCLYFIIGNNKITINNKQIDDIKNKVIDHLLKVKKKIILKSFKIEEFNPQSNVQLFQLFKWLNITSDKQTKKQNESFDREALIAIKKEIEYMINND